MTPHKPSVPEWNVLPGEGRARRDREGRGAGSELPLEGADLSADPRESWTTWTRELDRCPSFCRDAVWRWNLGPAPSAPSVLFCFDICLWWWHFEGRGRGPFPVTWQKDTSDQWGVGGHPDVDKEGSGKAGSLTRRDSVCCAAGAAP